MTKNQRRTQPFPLEKILTVSASDYLTTSPNAPSSYDLIGVHFEDHISSHVDDPEKDNTIKGMFALEVPEDAEIVVDYHSGTLVYDSRTKSIYGSASGTALIPIPKK